MINFFEFYDMPESFKVNQAALKKKFYEYSKKYHPDLHATADEEKQSDILELSTINNKAYHTLSNPAKLLDYILREHNLVNEGAKPQLPGDFLMEMMDINERLMEVDDAEQLAKITTEVLSVEGDLEAQLEGLTADYETVDDKAKESRLNQIADIYFRQKYLLRIRESLNTFASRF